MKVLVIGSGAREHALVWKLAQSTNVEEILVAPGNAGTASIATNVPVSAEDIEGLQKIARECRVDLTIVGPESPLAAGLVDRFQELGLRAFGPTKRAARIECSKIYAKKLMWQLGIPTASGMAFGSYKNAVAWVRDRPPPFVIKSDGLASG